MDYYKKYLKYKLKYYNLRNVNNINNNVNIDLCGGMRFDCDPKEKFKDICKENEKGKYKTKESCINDCENQYINKHLLDINIKGETVKFYLFIKDIIQNEKINVYIKGGNVIGLKLLKMIYNKYKNDDKKFREIFNKFLSLELIKDWDFAAYTTQPIDDKYREKLDKIAEKYKLVPRAKTFILYQTKRPILTEDKPLFEISIVEDADSFSKLEIPMTTMKVKITEYNLKYIYMFAKSFLAYKNKNEEFDFDIIKRMLDKINILIHPHKKGLYDVGEKKERYDKGELNDELIKFINTYDDFDKNFPQFLITHLEDPYRMLFRLIDKNIKKSEKIKQFIKDDMKDDPRQTWLFDSKWLLDKIYVFMKAFGEKIHKIYIDEYYTTNSLEKSLHKVGKFLEGINFGRTEIELDNFSEDGKKLINLMLGKLIKEITTNYKVDDIKKINKDNNKFYLLLTTLINKNYLK
jgi:hypothetical protein